MLIKFLKNLFNIGIKTLGVLTDVVPEYKTPYSACFDLVSNESHKFQNGELYVLGTGLRVEIPEGYCLLVFLRSSIGLSRLVIPNSVGVIDSDYRGEIKVPLLSFNEGEFEIYKGQRIAQAMLVKLTKANIIKRERLSQTERGEGGFGSTGVF